MMNVRRRGEKEEDALKHAHEERADAKRFRSEAKRESEGSDSWNAKRQLGAISGAIAQGDKRDAKRYRKDGM